MWAEDEAKVRQIVKEEIALLLKALLPPKPEPAPDLDPDLDPDPTA